MVLFFRMGEIFMISGEKRENYPLTKISMYTVYI